jgi:hypothetical protein
MSLINYQGRYIHKGCRTEALRKVSSMFITSPDLKQEHEEPQLYSPTVFQE